jgi:hypothetical protein
LLAAFVPSLIPWLVSTTGLSLQTTVLVVVGSALVDREVAGAAERRAILG